MKIGVDYYPEQWDRALWKEDADNMKKAGVKIVRMAEFAWGRLEPAEGEFDFSWLDEAVALFAERGIEVFLGTPTNCPPQWMFEKYPEIIQADQGGNRISIGIRGHRCLNSPVFREKCRLIITEMVSRYRDNPWVVGYQIDNELEANYCCCPVCAERFREFVRGKYGTVEKVNRAYGNVVWSGEYSDFSQINPPFGSFRTWLNPSYMLDFNRYASESTVDYVEFQRKLIRSLDEDALITTNGWLCENMPDFYDLFAGLDFVSYDNYPATVLPEEEETLYSHAFHLDFMRGIKRKNFWIMEQLSGGLGSWTPMQPTPRPGMIKGYAMQAAAHGADAILHFRWRTAAAGAEMFWHGLIDHSNVPGRRLEEFCDLCREAEQLKELQGSVIRNQVAVLYSSEQEYAFKIQPQAEGMHYFTQLKAWHDAFTAQGIGVDIIDWHSPLQGYKIVVAPTLLVTDEKIVKNLHAFAREGGHLVLTNRCGVKGENNQCIMAPLPTVFADMTGAEVREYDPIGTARKKIRLTGDGWGQEDADKEAFCTLWCDILEPHGAEVLVEYVEDFYEGEAAATVNPYGSGLAYYVGTVLNRRTMHLLARSIAERADVAYYENIPVGVERTVREKDGRQWVFYFNNTEKRQSVKNEETRRLAAGKAAASDGALTLEPFEMKILQAEAEGRKVI